MTPVYDLFDLAGNLLRPLCEFTAILEARDDRIPAAMACGFPTVGNTAGNGVYFRKHPSIVYSEII